MQGTPEVSRAVNEGRAVVSCAYPGYIPAQVSALLPENTPRRDYVAKIVNGQLVELRPGLPEDILPEMLANPAS